MRRLGLLLCASALVLTGCGDQQRLGAPEPTAAAEKPCPAEVGAHPTPPETTKLPQDRLVPEDVPRSMLLCRYEQDPPETFPPPSGYVPVFRLSGSRAIAGLADAAADLQVPPQVNGESHACTAMGGPTFPFLARIEYADRTVWLATQNDINSCSNVTNGSATSEIYLGGDFQASYDAGTWTRYRRSTGEPPPCWGPSGRFGQHRRMVPDQPVRIRVCSDQTELEPVTSPDRIHHVMQLLNTPETSASRNGCEGTITHSRRLLFEYASGRSVVVQVMQGCEPNVFQSSLSARLSDEQVRELFAALEP